MKQKLGKAVDRLQTTFIKRMVPILISVIHGTLS